MAATEQALRVNRQHMPFELDGGVAPRAAIGLIVLATDNTIEHEFRQIVPRVAGAAVFHTRILNDPDINPTTLRAMESRLADCSRTLRPGERIDVVAYGCTSASMVIGPAGVAARVHEGRPDVPVTNPVSAAVTGLGAMGAKRVALLTPYIDEVNQGMRNFFVGAGPRGARDGVVQPSGRQRGGAHLRAVDRGRAGRAGLERRRRRRVHLVHELAGVRHRRARRAAARQARSRRPTTLLHGTPCGSPASTTRWTGSAASSARRCRERRRRRDRAQVPAAGSSRRRPCSSPATAYEIEQTYLTAPAGVRRVRRRVGPDGERFWLNEKHSRGGITRTEDERELTADEYRSLLGGGRPASRAPIAQDAARDRARRAADRARHLHGAARPGPARGRAAARRTRRSSCRRGRPALSTCRRTARTRTSRSRVGSDPTATGAPWDRSARSVLSRRA